MNKELPTVSVVMPVYNVAAYVAAAIASVLAQSFKDFELLIVDDGSTDHSVQLCEQFADKRIRIIRQKNRGLAGARNTGIRHARGQFVAFLDSDDLWTPNKLDVHMAHLQSNPRLGVSYCASGFIDDSGQPLGYLQRPKLNNVSAKDVFMRNPIGNGSVPVIRREVLDEICFTASFDGDVRECWFDESFRQSEDIECWTRIAILTKWQFAGVAAALTLYRVNDSGLSAQIDKQLASWDRFLSKLQSYAPSFAQQHGRLARGYQLRYLARRAVRMGRGGAALRFAVSACLSAPGVLLYEPVKTLTTLAASLCVAALPLSAYRWIERAAMGMAGALQRDVPMQLGEKA